MKETRELSARNRNGLQRFFFEITNKWEIYILIVPAAIYLLIYGYFTLPYLAIAFQKYSFRTGIFSKFVGLQNFEYFFRSSWGWIVTRNTIVINVMFIIVGSAASIMFALMLNEIRAKKFLKTTQSIMLLPYFLSWVVVSYILQGMLGTTNGLVNIVRESLGYEAISYYTEPKHWYVILAITNIWKMAGYNTIIYLATITGIDESLYEAAKVDGGNRWHCLKYITLPLLFPTVIMLTLMSIGRIFYGNFGMMYALFQDNGILMPVTEVIDTYVYRTFKLVSKPSLSTAIGLYQSVVGFILVFGTNTLVRKIYPDGALF